MDLKEKFDSRQAVINVIGLGYVGLPLAVAFAEAGFRVVGIDINEGRVNSINRGESYVSDTPSKQVAALTTIEPAAVSPTYAERSSTGNHGTLTGQSPAFRQAGRLSATTDFDALCKADAVIVCVPTPLDETKNPNMSHIISATEEISQRLHPNMLIVLESTTYPGTTEELVLPCLEQPKRSHLKLRAKEPSMAMKGNDRSPAIATGKTSPIARQMRSTNGSTVKSRRLMAGKDFFLAFSPERIDPGRIDHTIRTTPKILGGVTAQCTKMAHALYSAVIEQLVLVSSPKVAEMAKLLENTFRAVNIALVNEIAIMCDRLELDVWEVIQAAKTKPFGFMSFHPGPGLGGHCIPIDPQFLAWKLKTLNYNARFIQLAAEINFEMPHYVLGKIADALNDKGKALNGASVLILGVAYKADVGDLRESPALDLIHLLQKKNADVSYHDPYVCRLQQDGLNMTAVALDIDTLATADCVVIATDHSCYDWQWVVQHSDLVVDSRNATKDVTPGQARIVML